jgi:hypothetical protein
LNDATAKNLVALGIGVTHLEILTNQEMAFSTALAPQGLIADMRSALSQPRSDMCPMSLHFINRELDGPHISDALAFL